MHCRTRLLTYSLKMEPERRSKIAPPAGRASHRILPMRTLPFLACLLAGAAGAVAAAPAGNPAFDRAIDELGDDWVRSDPLAATTSQYFRGAEQDALDRRLVARDAQTGIPLDPAERTRRTLVARAALDQLRKFNPTELSPTQQTSQAYVLWKLSDVLRAYDFADQRFVFEQFRGLQVGLVTFLSQTHPIRNARDLENYLVRLDQVAGLIDLGIREAQSRAQVGVIPPKFILKSTLEGLDRFLSPSPGQNVLVTSLVERAAKVGTIPPAQRDAAVQKATAIVREAVIPSYQRVRALLVDHEKVATDDAGLWRLPRGPQAYAAALATNTTTDLTPDQIHEIGLKEVERIERTMDGLLRQLGYNDGSVKARYEKLNRASQPPAEPDPRPALIAKFDEILRDAERRAVTAFDLRPRAPIEVKREPPFTEKSAAAHYSFPAPDGTRPGIFWAPLPGPLFDVVSMRTLVYHEGVPGHHFHLALQQELPEIPKFRQLRSFGILSAFSEGWALYAEQLAVELGWYEGDVKGLLGQLDKELFRARRLVVDTGLHAKHWTRQQAIDYGIPAHEVERYVVMPGQACSYKIGQLKILEVRAKAQRELGAGFSLKEFHNVVLRNGELPLPVFARTIDAWIAESKRRP